MTDEETQKGIIKLLKQEITELQRAVEALEKAKEINLNLKDMGSRLFGTRTTKKSRGGGSAAKRAWERRKEAGEV